MNRVCPACGAEYMSWATKCSECGIVLVDPADAPNPLQLSEDEQVVYELGEWSLGLQSAAAEAMAESEIPHGWDGTDLVIHIDHEQRADEILDGVERAGLIDGAPLPSTLGGDANRDAASMPSDAEVAYELDEWPVDDRDQLRRTLSEGGIPHRWEDDTTLVVSGTDEAMVESMLDDIEYPDAAPNLDDDIDSASPDSGDALDGGPPVDEEERENAETDSFEQMSELFVAADRLRSNPLDPDGIATISRISEIADPDAVPYGIAPAVWHQALAHTDAIADALAAEPPSEEVVGDEAMSLRELLRPFV